MNLLLLAPEDVPEPGLARVAASRYPPRPEIWPPAIGRTLRVGLIDGGIGMGSVCSSSDDAVEIRFSIDAEPPAPCPVVLVMALPRPKMLRRILRTAAELGIKQLYLVNSYRVEKSYWQSPLLTPATLNAYLLAGLEQACDSVMPQVHLRPRLKPFVEDELPHIAGDSLRVIAHPEAPSPLPDTAGRAVTLAIGPEGGFSDYEIALFASAGFVAATLGPRILRVETALPVLVTQLMAQPG
jgi:16S rRNA (uracil1498-N3)-methyltransferase